jgi:hypothetical protein
MSYNGLEVVTPSPLAGAGGAAINNNFMALSTKIATTLPGPTDDSDSGYSEGSRWYDSGTTVEWVCTDPTPGAAMWKAIASGAYLALGGGTMTGTLDMAANGLNMNSGGGTGGGTLSLDGGNITNGGVITAAQVNVGGSAVVAGFSINCTGVNSEGYPVVAGYFVQNTIHPSGFYSSAFIQWYGDAQATVIVRASATPPQNLTEWQDNGGTVLTSVNGTGQISAPMVQGGGLILTPAGAPGSPTEGQMYYDSSGHHLYVWNGSAWKQCDN